MFSVESLLHGCGLIRGQRPQQHHRHRHSEEGDGKEMEEKPVELEQKEEDEQCRQLQQQLRENRHPNQVTDEVSQKHVVAWKCKRIKKFIIFMPKKPPA